MSDELGPAFQTLLSFSGIGVPPYSARGLTQSLEPIDIAANLRRTVNGVLKDISFDGFHKYKSTISCSDQRVPAVDGVWPGKEIVVDCVQELCYLTTGGGPARTAVSGSSRVEGSYTYYRPRLTMLVTTFSTTLDEYGATVGWQMTLEEK